MYSSKDSDTASSNRTAAVGPDAATEQRSGIDFAAPLGGAAAGHLLFPAGAAGVTLHVDPTLVELCRAHFERHIPTVQAQDGVVTIRYPSFSLFNWLVYWREPVAEVTLTAALPWQIKIHGGVSKLTADLRGLRLAKLSIDGGASGVLVMLPAPVGRVPIRIGGGASNVTFRRAAAIAARVHVQSGASNLTVDEHYFGAMSGEIHWETPEARQAADYYDIHIGGGASNLTIGSD
ncbi:MAG: hypothetical protein KJZ93_24835 [Caldilineaceae bacterium]|nr:hypothetical protein [Caldilineaceae bacterium]